MIAERLARVHSRIAQAAQRAGRNPADITLVGVSKQHSVAEMLEAYRAGLRHFGENRVEEVGAKFPSFLQAVDSTSPPTLHFIGHLQSRKVASALQYAQLIHSVDSLKLARRINRLAERDGYPPVPVLLECNVSGEAAKAGFDLAAWETRPEIREAFFTLISQMAQLPFVKIKGLMTMAPYLAEPEQTRPVFASLKKLQLACTEAFPAINWSHLSMGMSNDFEVAIEEGATLVRVGRAIFSEG